MKWPQQARPNKEAWRQWEIALGSLTTEDGETLRTPQNPKWTTDASKYRTWKYYVDPKTKVLYTNEEEYEPVRQTRRHIMYEKFTQKKRDREMTDIPVQPTKTKQGYIVNTWYVENNNEQINKTIQPQPEYKIAVSDGSVNQGIGTFGWIKETKDKKQQQ